MSDSIFCRETRQLQALYLDETQDRYEKPFAVLLLHLWSNGQKTYQIILNDLDKKEVIKDKKNFRDFKTQSMALRFWQNVIQYWLTFSPILPEEPVRMVIYFDRVHLYSPEFREIARLDLVKDRIVLLEKEHQTGDAHADLYEEMLIWLELFNLDVEKVKIERY